MPNLKNLRIRIDSVKSTQKITSAMKMVAAAKLRRAQEQAEAARPYSKRMDRLVTAVATSRPEGLSGPALLSGTGKSDRQIILAVSSDRGLCGGFNANIFREVRRKARLLEAEGKHVKFVSVGRKASEAIRRIYGDKLILSFENLGRSRVSYSEASKVASKLLEMFDNDNFDVCTLIYNHFQSAISQVVTAQQLIPFSTDQKRDLGNKEGKRIDTTLDFEPDEDEILLKLLPRNIGVQIFHSLLESAASEHGARMTAMDNATRNAGDMIDELTLTYNRTRQAVITSELIEIISGAEAL